MQATIEMRFGCRQYTKLQPINTHRIMHRFILASSAAGMNRRLLQVVADALVYLLCCWLAAATGVTAAFTTRATRVTTDFATGATGATT